MNKPDDKILERIRALLSMAADTASPHEASIAAGRARKLMDQHQVGLDDLTTESGFGFANVGAEYRFMPKWLSVLALGVGYLNDVKVVKQHRWQTINNSYSYQILFQGYESDVHHYQGYGGQAAPRFRARGDAARYRGRQEDADQPTSRGLK